MTTPRWRALSSSDSTVATTQRWRLDIAYDGAAFSGFAYQPEFTTVVGLLRETFASTLHLSEQPLIVGAGRTDAGVHAFAQVIHVDLPTTLFAKNRGCRIPIVWRYRSTSNFVVGSGCFERCRFPTNFTRAFRRRGANTATSFSRPSRRHSNSPTRGPGVSRALDLAAMNRATSDILGTHDFRAFCRRPTNSDAGEPLTRHVYEARWERIEDSWSMSPQNETVVRLAIRAQSFCHNMVRCLVSAMVAVGQGRIAENTLKERLESLRRDHLPAPAPASGLCLVGVGYPEFAGGASSFVR